MIDNVLVAVDGSEGSKKAVAFAADLVRQSGAKAVVLHVLEPPPVVTIGFVDAYGVAQRAPTAEELAQAKKNLDALAASFPSDRVEKVVEIGPAAQVICDQAEARHASMVVLGARGLGAVGRWLLGSVSDRVVHHCKAPVTVVH